MIQFIQRNANQLLQNLAFMFGKGPNLAQTRRCKETTLPFAYLGLRTIGTQKLARQNLLENTNHGSCKPWKKYSFKKWADLS